MIKTKWLSRFQSHVKTLSFHSRSVKMNFKVEQFFDYVQFETIYTPCYFGEINEYDSQIYVGNFIQTVRKSKYEDIKRLGVVASYILCYKDFVF